MFTTNQMDVATRIFNFYSPVDKIGACGGVAAVVNAFCESSFQATIIGDHDAAFGLYQTHADADVRRIVLAKDTNIEEQCGFIWRDFQTTEKAALAKIRAATTSADATYAWCRWYERPAKGDVEALRRAGLAAQWMKTFGVTV